MSQGKIFREYIGSKSATGKSVAGFPVEIINGGISNFHFILASVKEYYNHKTKKGNGMFHEAWNVKNFNVESIKKMKSEKQNVKVVISIGGRGSDYPAFDPEDKIKWIAKAKESLNQIIFGHYKSDNNSNTTVIDGIDIAYERIDSDQFACCMGEVIEELKSKINGLVVSIAPSLPVLSYYEKLYQDNKSDISWVNFQYYYEKLPEVKNFLNRHNYLVTIFPVEKLLAGFSTDPNDEDNIPLQVFFDACKQLNGTGTLPGIFVWVADDSIHYDNNLPFYVEKEAQKLMLK